jgi:hypothetical protein
MDRKQNRKERRNAQPKGITAISVSGYKSIREEQRIEIRPLTILAGANSSGKSSIMQPLLLLKQTLETPYDPGALLLDGPNVQITSADQVLSRAVGQQPAKAFSMQLEIGERLRLRLNFEKASGKGFDIGSMSYDWRGPTYEIRLGMSAQEIETLVPSGLKDVAERIQSSAKERIQWSVVRNRCFLYLMGALGGEPMFPVGPTTPLGPSRYRDQSVEACIEKVIHVPGLRGNPERTYKTSAVGEEFPGKFNDYVASVVSQWQEEPDESSLNLLGKNLEDLGLTWKIKARPIDAARVELRVGRLPHSRRGGALDLVSIADVGFGVSQTLPVIVALLVAKPGHMVYLEQPEIHLHPRAQSRVATALADTARRGVAVVAETHSSLLLRGVQTLVAKGELSPELVKLHWFTRRADGATVIQSTDLDEQGRFGESWPEDFDDVLLESERSYLDAVESRSLQ